MKEDLSKLRKNYNSGELNQQNLISDPFFQFDLWFKEALKEEPFEPNAMMLSTSNNKSKPSSRIVLLKEYSDNGFVFFTNYKSRKGLDISANPWVSLLFYWPKLLRQVRIEGSIVKIQQKLSEEYFNSRPFESNVAAVISKQSGIVESYSEFVNTFNNKLNEGKVKRPKHWGGFNVIPDKFEFWQGRPNRLHDRFQYEIEKRKWKINRLYP